MTKPSTPIPLASALLIVLASCSTGAGDEIGGSFSASFGSNTQSMSAGDGDGDSSSGDGDADTTPGDGDGTATTPGDGDGTPGDGDGDGTAGDGDGDGDGDGGLDCVQVCDGKVTSSPDTCGNPYIIGRTPAKAGFFRGASTQAATNQDTETCGPHSNPDNLDTGKDHFYRIYLVEGDTIMASENPNGWDAKIKIHDEADCIGNAKVCSMDLDPATIEYTALKTDWFTIVVDGVSLGLGDYGDYALNVTLVPGPGIDECGCP